MGVGSLSLENVVKGGTEAEDVDVARVAFPLFSRKLRPNLWGHIEGCALAEGVSQLGITSKALHHVEIRYFGHLGSIN